MGIAVRNGNKFRKIKKLDRFISVVPRTANGKMNTY